MAKTTLEKIAGAMDTASHEKKAVEWLKKQKPKDWLEWMVPEKMMFDYAREQGRRSRGEVPEGASSKAMSDMLEPSKLLPGQAAAIGPDMAKKKESGKLTAADMADMMSRLRPDRTPGGPPGTDWGALQAQHDAPRYDKESTMRGLDKMRQRLEDLQLEELAATAANKDLSWAERRFESLALPPGRKTAPTRLDYREGFPEWSLEELGSERARSGYGPRESGFESPRYKSTHKSPRGGPRGQWVYEELPPSPSTAHEFPGPVEIYGEPDFFDRPPIKPATRHKGMEKWYRDHPEIETYPGGGPWAQYHEPYGASDIELGYHFTGARKGETPLVGGQPAPAPYRYPDYLGPSPYPSRATQRERFMDMLESFMGSAGKKPPSKKKK